MAGIINSAMDAIISVSAEQKIVLFNPAAEKIFGYKASDVLGQPLDMLIPKQFRQAHREHLQRFGGTGVTQRSMASPAQLAGLRANGAEFPIEATISQVQVAGEKIFTVILRDVSERKKAEEETRRQQQLIQELSIPVLRLREGLLLVPLVGDIDDERIDQLNHQLLGRIHTERARAVVVDITGVPSVNTYVANLLIKTAKAARLLGAELILTGISQQITYTLVRLGISWGDVLTEGDLQRGIETATGLLQTRARERAA